MKIDFTIKPRQSGKTTSLKDIYNSYFVGDEYDGVVILLTPLDKKVRMKIKYYKDGNTIYLSTPRILNINEIKSRVDNAKNILFLCDDYLLMTDNDKALVYNLIINLNIMVNGNLNFLSYTTSDKLYPKRIIDLCKLFNKGVIEYEMLSREYQEKVNEYNDYLLFHVDSTINVSGGEFYK